MRLPTILCITALFYLACQSSTSENSSDPQETKSEYRIAYNVYVPDSLNDDNYEIFTMQMDGSDKKNITNHPDVAWTYLAHGIKIFFISDRDTAGRVMQLYQMDYKGDNIRQITDFRLTDSWMGSRNDGQELIICPHQSVDSVLYLIDLDGNILEKLETETPYASDPSFSPDGQKIAFVGKTKRSKRDPDFNAEIYVMDTDGSNSLQLTQYPASDTTAEWFAYKAGPPRWHPTENYITYQSKQNGKYSLYAVTPDGQKHWKLTDNAQDEGWHDWSPDGRWLAIELFDSEQTQFHIGLMNWETKELNILTDTTYQYQQAPVFVKISAE